MLRFFILLSVLASFVTHADNINTLITQAQANNVQAQYALALEYQQGKTTPRDLAEALYWFEKAAQAGNSKAMGQVADAYLNGLGTNKDPQQGLYWLTKLALTGSPQAQTALGQYYQALKNGSVNAQSLAQLWLHIASANDPKAQAQYDQLLEDKFNAQRARQVASINQLEQAVSDAEPSNEQNQTVDNESTAHSANQDNGHAAKDYILLGVFICIMVGVIVWLRRKKQQRALQLQAEHTEKQSQNKKVNDQQLLLKRQKKQLETIFREVKRLQGENQKLQTQLAQTPKSAPPPPPVPANQKLALACAVLGFSPNQIPNEKALKIRYKQLSKIYHPDMKGSEEEMKRLNNAMKIVVASQKK